MVLAGATVGLFQTLTGGLTGINVSDYAERKMFQSFFSRKYFCKFIVQLTVNKLIFSQIISADKLKLIFRKFRTGYTCMISIIQCIVS